MFQEGSLPIKNTGQIKSMKFLYKLTQAHKTLALHFLYPLFFAHQLAFLAHAVYWSLH